MKSTLILCVVTCALLAPMAGKALPPSKNAQPSPEAKFVPDIGYKSWQQRREKLHDALDDLGGSKPIRAIRKEIGRAVKDTHSYMKSTLNLDARETINAKDQQKYQEEAELLAARFDKLGQALQNASFDTEASVKVRRKWKETRRRVLLEVRGSQAMLEDTVESLKKLKVAP